MILMTLIICLTDKYRTLAIITRGFYYFSIFSCVGFSLMFGGIPMKLGGYKTREVIIRAWLMMASVRYVGIDYVFSNVRKRLAHYG